MDILASGLIMARVRAISRRARARLRARTSDTQLNSHDSSTNVSLPNGNTRNARRCGARTRTLSRPFAAMTSCAGSATRRRVDHGRQGCPLRRYPRHRHRRREAEGVRCNRATRGRGAPPPCVPCGGERRTNYYSVASTTTIYIYMIMNSQFEAAAGAAKIAERWPSGLLPSPARFSEYTSRQWILWSSARIQRASLLDRRPACARVRDG